MKRLFDEHIARISRDLSGSWRFLTDENDIGIASGYQASLPNAETVSVPSVWNNELGLLKYDGACWYEKSFYSKGGTLRFVFEAVMTSASAWLDGKLLGTHYGAFSSFDFIATAVKEGMHTLILRVDSRFDEESIPQKKVDWFNYGGIARDVTLEELCGITILSNKLEYSLSQDLKSVVANSVLCLYNASDKEESSQLVIKVDEHEIYSGEITLGAHEKRILTTPMTEIKNIELWDVDNPRLYTLSATTATDDLLDRVGFRLIEVADGKILLNKKSIELRGVNRHEEHPEWGFAFPQALMKKDIDLITNMSCNTIRGAHYPQSKVFVDMLDERGILFWSEIPIWGGGFDTPVLNNPIVVERGLTMHKEMVNDYYNHPSIIIWGMHNEIYAVVPNTYNISKQYSEYLRENGGNRLITHATIFPLEDKSLEFDDIVCINMYHGWYGKGFSDWDAFIKEFSERRKEFGVEEKPVIFSEFGAGALYGCHNEFDSVRWSEEYQSDLLEYCLKLFKRTPMVVGYYIWQFCDIRTSDEMDINRVRSFNNKGLLNEYRKPKKAYFTVKRLYEEFKNQQ